MTYDNSDELKIYSGEINKERIKKLFRNQRFINFEEAIMEIIDRINDAETKKDEAYKQLEEWNKDEEIQKLKSEIESLQNKLWNTRRYSFEITPEEHEAIEEWKKKHVKEKHNGDAYAGAIGGRYKYIFVPTSIGTVGSIKCSCGETFCFSELW